VNTSLTRRPLRVKLTFLLVVLLGLGILVSSFIATTALRDYLMARIDEQMTAGSQRFERLPSGPPPTPPENSGQQDLRPPSLFYLEVIPADGSSSTVLSTPTQDSVTTPAVPGIADLPSLEGQFLTIGSVDSPDQWRALVTPMAGESGWVVTAFPLADLQATVGRLVLLQLIVGIVVVVLAGGIGYVLVRRSLQPLDGVAATATRIAAGDLSLRVQENRSSTEVEELSTSFNTMVTRIEESFAAQQQSESQARASEERMRRFVADASHELRTPLTTIRGFAELIEEGAAEDPDLAVTRIQDEARRMGGLIDDLLLLARLDEQRPMSRERLDLVDIATAAVSGARVTMPDRAIDVVVDTESHIPVIAGDEGRLRQVVDNLLSNAHRYSPPGQPIVVRVSTRSDERGDWAVLDVTDEGPGLSPEDAERIFERLYRTDEARSRVHGGSGLGLAIVKSIVDAHGGEVFVETTPGLGSTFGFRLPPADQDA
jgi:two-component system, OmpR family, sensor kinase